MNIVLGQENILELEQRHIVLELDTLVFGDGMPVTAYCVIEKVSVQELINLQNLKDLHAKLIKNYKLKNWDFCEQALEHLKGCWQGEVDSFYQIMESRIQEYKKTPPLDDWTGWIYKSPSSDFA